VTPLRLQCDAIAWQSAASAKGVGALSASRSERRRITIIRVDFFIPPPPRVQTSSQYDGICTVLACDKPSAYRMYRLNCVASHGLTGTCNNTPPPMQPLQILNAGLFTRKLVTLCSTQNTLTKYDFIKNVLSSSQYSDCLQKSHVLLALHVVCSGCYKIADTEGFHFRRTSLKLFD